jgi:uncharacterized membrane protein
MKKKVSHKHPKHPHKIKESKSLGLKLILAVAETILAIPIIDKLAKVEQLWVFLPFMVILHLLCMYISMEEKKGVLANIFGVIGNMLAWMPLYGFAFHFATAILLWYEYIKENPNK